MPSALEILKPHDNRIQSVIEKTWAPLIGTVFGFGCACIANMGMRKPVFSGIQKHIALAGAGVLLASYVENRRQEYLAERDAVLRHYIELHPEDFLTPERKKFAEVLEPWVPIR